MQNWRQQSQLFPRFQVKVIFLNESILIHLLVNSFFSHQLYSVNIMKEEKRKSMLTLLLAPRGGQPSPNKDTKQNQALSDFHKFNIYPEQSSAQKFTRVVKRIGTKQTISSFHAQLSQPKATTSLHVDSSNHSLEILREVKAEKQNVQVKEMRKKLKRVGKKVWVTAFKQNISQLQQGSQITNKQQANTQNKTEKYQYSQFKQQGYTLQQPTKSQDYSIKNNHQKHEQTKNGRFTVNESIKKKEPSRFSAPDLKKDKSMKRMNQGKQFSDSQKQSEISETNNIPINADSQLEIQVDNKNQFEEQPEIPEVDIDKMLEQIQTDQAINKSSHKSTLSDSISKRKSIKNPRRSSRFSNKTGQLHDNETGNNIEMKAKRPRGRESTFKIEENKTRQANLKSPIAQKLFKKQSTFQESNSLQEKSLKKPLPPAYPFSQENTKSILSSDHEGLNQMSSKQKTPLLGKQSSIQSGESSMTGSKIELDRGQVREFRRQVLVRQRQGESYHSMHYSQKKQGGTRKIGIQRFRNGEAGQENRITNSLKKNKNLEINWYVAEARKEVTTDNVFRQTGYRI